MTRSTDRDQRPPFTAPTAARTGEPTLAPDDERSLPPFTFAAFGRIARRPLWIGALVLVLSVAGGFAALAQWQVSRSVETASVEQRATERVSPLEEVAATASQVDQTQEGQLVEAQVRMVPGDFTVLSGRLHEGRTGFWLVGHALTAQGDSLAVALGWAPTRAIAEAAIADVPESLAPLQGRYLGSESPQQSDFEQGERSALAVAELINEWDEVDAVYGGYVVLSEATPQLTTIDAPPPDQQVALNWLNVFYAVEWVLFAGFAFYLWYRLVKDVWERELEEQVGG